MNGVIERARGLAPRKQKRESRKTRSAYPLFGTSAFWNQVASGTTELIPAVPRHTDEVWVHLVDEKLSFICGDQTNAKAGLFNV
jgi:hypothetical protein